MGTEYYAINLKNKTFYDLGKGGWYALTDKEAFQDVEYLANEILTECYYINDADYWEDQEGKKDTVEYVTTRIAPDLYEMMRDTPPDQIRIMDDCGDDITICKAKGYRCVGTRYYSKGSPEYLESLTYMNRHFQTDNPLHKRWYDPEQYKNYPEFSIY